MFRCSLCRVLCRVSVGFCADFRTCSVGSVGSVGFFGPWGAIVCARRVCVRVCAGARNAEKFLKTLHSLHSGSKILHQPYTNPTLNGLKPYTRRRFGLAG